MGIRKKGFILVSTYNLMGILAVFFLLYSDSADSRWNQFLVLITLPISLLSILNSFHSIQPFYTTLIIQLIVFFITTGLVDLILRVLSPEYTEKQRIRFQVNRQIKEAELIRLEQLLVYFKYDHDIANFIRLASSDEKLILSVERWYQINNILKDIDLINNTPMTTNTKRSIEKRISESVADEATMRLLYKIK